MKHTSFFKRFLSMLLIVAMLAGNVLPGMAIGNHRDETGSSNVSFTKVDNGEVSASLQPAGRTEATDEALYADTDMVRVSIIMEKAATMQAGFDTMEIASNAAAVAYRDSLKAEQTALIQRIESATRVELDVVWNLTLAVNMISVNVPYGQIKTIEKMAGVKSVVLENQYVALEVQTGGNTTNMATSGAQTGSSLVWNAGYTGAGSRIAVIDTGTDTDHQSLNAKAFEYSLSLLAEKAGMRYEDYIASLDLLDAEEIASVADQLNMVDYLDVDAAYFNTKLPFGFNYKDADYDITHDNDEEGEHGSHVAGIATANAWLYNEAQDFYGKALEYCFMQGVAPDAQLLTMKVFGKHGSPYDSDYFAAIEDAIVLGADVINLSLGSVAPGRGNHNNAVFQEVMNDLTESGVVVSISAGNAGPWAETAENAAELGGMGYLYNTDVSLDTLGQPGSFTNSLCVASVENDGMVGFYIEIDGNMFVYNEDNRDGQFSNKLFREIAGEYEYVYIDGVGKAEDWAAVADVLPGRIALCSRGETNFAEKANLAIQAGAVAVFIYNNQSGVINLDLTEYLYTNPVAAITMTQGIAIRELSTPVMDENGNVRYRTGKMTISNTVGMGYFGSDYYTMSDFSSWGVTGTLELKPEITAPGGNIYSILGSTPENSSVGGYAIMSGTSMASPQVAGMAALMAQYIRENDLEEKTGMDARHLIQSLLMSTAMPLLVSEGEYYPVLQQGAGMANVYDAMTADSFIVMGAGTNNGAADGKVKVELFDDPARVGAYSATFTVYNMQDVEKLLNLKADFFIQGLESDGQHLYMSYATEMIPVNVIWSIGGAAVVSEELDTEGMDFNGDGFVNAEDGQALLDYVTGKIETISAVDKADVDGDGDIDSHDPYVFLSNLSTTTAVLPAGGAVEIRVDFSLPASVKKQLNEMFPNGTYLQGYLYAETLGEEEQVDTVHSIPVLGFFGNWSDPSMFDVGEWTTFATGEDTRTPYIGRTRGNDWKVRYDWDPGYNYSFGGNPLVTDSVYMPERNAMNSTDAMDGVSFIAIRNADQSRVTVVNETTGQTILDQLTGAVNMAYYYGALGWQNSGMFLQTNFSLKDAQEDDRISMSFTLVPEYYIDAEGNVDWDALGEGATRSISWTIDNTAPELLGVSIDVLNNTMTVKASDNQYIAAVGLYNKTGTRCLAQTGAKQDIEKGEVAEYTFSLAAVNGKKFLLQVFDYAMNAATYMIEMQIGEASDLPTMMAYDLVSRHWCGFDNTFEYDYKVGTPRVAYADHIFYAATIAEHYAFASTNKGDLYVMPEDDLSDTTFITNMGQIMYDMAYSVADDEIYAVNDRNELYTIHKLTGELTYVGTIGLNTNTLACDKEGTFFCNELGTGKVYSFTLETMDEPQLLMEDPFLTQKDPIYGDNNGTEGNMGMEYDPNTGMICWNSHLEVLMGAYITFAYYYEIDPATGEFTRYADFWHEMGGLMIPNRTGTGGGWADPTDKVIGVKLNRDQIDVIRGTSFQLTANVMPWTATDRTVTWTSADESIATVNKKGVVTGISEGTTTIRATSNLDPDFYAECTVNVELLHVTLHGTTIDESGKSVFYEWDMSQDTGWVSGAALNYGMTSATYSTALDVYYMMDNVDNQWMMHKVDAAGNILQSAANSMTVAMWDMAYNPYFSQIHGKEQVSGTYYYYLLSPKNPMDLDSVGFNLGDMASYLVGIVSLGYEQQSDENGTIYDTEHLVLMDNDGYVWDFWIYDVAGGGMNALYNITKSDLTLEFLGDGAMDNLYTSLMVGEDGALYLSAYDGNSTNEIWHLGYDPIDHKYNAVKIGEMGENVYATTITSVTVNGDVATTALSPKPAYTMAATEITEAELAAAASKASFSVSQTELDTKLEINAAGTKDDPIPFVIGDNTGVAPTSGSDKYCYFTYTAEKAGTVTVSSAGMDWRANYFVNGEQKNTNMINPKYDGNTITCELNAGDVFMLMISPYISYKYGGEITVNFAYANADGTPVNPGEPTPEPEPERPAVETITVYFRNDWKWSSVNAYYWGSTASTNPSWPGVAIEKVGTALYGTEERDVYAAQIPADATGLIFNGYNPNDKVDQQTPDITDFADGDAYYIYWDNGNKVAKFQYPAEPEQTEVSLVLGTNALTSGTKYTYTAAEEGRLEFDFVIKDAEDKTIYQYAYSKGERVKIFINGNYIPNVADTKLSVAAGQTMTVELQSVDGGEYTATLTMTAVEPASKLVLGNNNIARKTDYSFIAPQSGTLYTTIVELWCDGTYCTETSLSSSVVFKINGTVVYAFQNSYEVKTGDEITVTLGTSFGESANAILNLSYEGFYSHPAGSRGNPIVLDYADFPTTVEIPAGETVWYKLTGFYSGYYMDIHGENAYAIIGSKTYEASNGVLRIPATTDLQIGNAGQEAAAFELSAGIEEGTSGNPKDMVIGDQTAELEPSKNYYFDFVATQAGQAVVTVTGDNWRFFYSLIGVDGTVQISEEDHHNVRTGDTNFVTVDLIAGQTIIIKLATIDSSFTSPGGELTVNLQFTPAEGACQHANTELRNFKAATCTAEGYSGDTYCLDCGVRVKLGETVSVAPHTPGAEASCTKPQLCTVCFTELKPATGHSYDNGVCTGCGEAEPNIDPAYALTVGENSLTSGHVYSYVVTEEGRLEFDFVVKDANGSQIYQYTYGKGQRVKIVINGKDIPNLADTKISVRAGDVITVELVSVDGGEYTATLTMSQLIPAVKLYLGDNDIDKDIDYSFIAAVDGTLYVTIKELIVDNYYCTETSLSSVAFKINGVSVTGFENAYEVKAGDEITVYMHPSKSEPAYAVLNLSYEGFYKHPFGSRGNPAIVNFADFQPKHLGYDIGIVPTSAIKIPAGTAYWVKFVDFPDSAEIKLMGADGAYVIYSGQTITVAKGQALNMSDIRSIQIGNSGSYEATFDLFYVLKEGTLDNPKDLVEGNNTVTLEKSANYYYDFVAKENGAATFTVSGENWRFWYSLINADGTVLIKEEDHQARRGDASTITVELTTGQSIVLKLGTLNSSWTAPGGDITVNFHFEATAEPCQHTNTEIRNAAEATCTADGYTGDTYCTDCGEKIATGEVVTATGHNFVDGVCTICGAPDPDYVPDHTNPLALGKNDIQSGIVYTYTAPADGRMEFTVGSVYNSANSKQYSWYNGSKLQILINGKAMTASSAKMNVAGGQAITVEIVSLDGDTYTSDITLKEVTAAEKLTIGNNALTQNLEYVYVAEQSGTVYVSVVEMLYNGAPVTASALGSSVLLTINGASVSVFEKSYTVQTGDEIAVIVKDYSWDGSGVVNTVINLSYEGFYQHPLGSLNNPVELLYKDCPTASVEIAAGTSVWYELESYYDSSSYGTVYPFSGKYLVVTGEGAYIMVGSDRSDAVDSVAKALMSDKVLIQIGNDGASAATFQISVEIPEGTKDNPKDLVEGDNTVILGSYKTYYYDYVATMDGTVTVKVSGENWKYTFEHYDAEGTKLSGKDYYNKNGDADTQTLEVKTGEKIVVMVGTSQGYSQPGGEITVNFHFETEGGTTPEPTPDPENVLVLGKNNIESGIVYTYVVPADGRMEFTVGSVYNSANTKQYSWYNGSKLQILINGKAMTASSAKMNVAAGQAITVEIVSLDGDAYTADITLKEVAAAESMVIGNNNLTQDLEYVYVAEQAGTVYVSVVEMYYNGNPATASDLGMNILMTINGASVSVFEKSYNVTAGDEIAIVLKDYSWSGGGTVTAVINLSYEGFYQHPLGSLNNPVELLYNNCPTDSIEIAAGAAAWYELESYYDSDSWSTVYPFKGKYLVVAGEGAYILVGSSRYDADNGVAKVLMNEQTMVQIGNSGTSAATFAISVEIPEGHVDNPRDLVEGDNQVTLGSYATYYFDYTAITDGTVTVKVSGDNWRYNFAHYAADGSKISAKDYYNKNGDADTQTLELKAGEKIVVMVGTSQGYSQPGGEITVNFHFEEAKAPCLHETTRTEIENEVAGDCTTDARYDQVVYCVDCGEELSRETITTTAPGHKFEEGVCTECGAEDPDYVPNQVIVEITNEVDATNGVVIATWDPAKMTLTGVTVHADYFSIVEKEGSITIGYIALQGIEAGESVVTLVFEAVDPADAEVKITVKQINNESEIPCQHQFSAAVVAAPTVETAGKLELCCDFCGQKQNVELPALNETDYTYEVIQAPTAAADGIGRYTWNVTDYGTFRFDVVIRHEVAATDTQIVIESKTGTTGDIIRLEVVLKNNPGIQGIMGQVQYDTSVMTLINVENGIVLESLTWDKSLVWDAAEDSLENGLLCVLEFRIAEDAPVGSYFVSFVLEDAFNEKEEAVFVSVVSAEVTVSNVVYGDVNGDGKINLADVLRLRKFLANRDPNTGASTVDVEAGADCNGDGKVNLSDVLRLRKFLANRDPVTGESSVVLGPQ